MVDCRGKTLETKAHINPAPLIATDHDRRPAPHIEAEGGNPIPTNIDLLVDHCSLDRTVLDDHGQPILPIVSCLFDRAGTVLAFSVHTSTDLGYATLKLLRDVLADPRMNPTRELHGPMHRRAKASKLRRILIHTSAHPSWQMLRKQLPTSWIRKGQTVLSKSAGEFTSRYLGANVGQIRLRHGSAWLKAGPRARQAAEISSGAQSVQEIHEELYLAMRGDHLRPSARLWLHNMTRSQFLDRADAVLRMHPLVASSCLLAGPPLEQLEIASRLHSLAPPAMRKRFADRPGSLDLADVPTAMRSEVKMKIEAIDRFMTARRRKGLAEQLAAELGMERRHFYKLVAAWRHTRCWTSIMT